MEPNHFDFEVLQPSMLRMIRSARSRCSRDGPSENSMDIGMKGKEAETSRWPSDFKSAPRKSISSEQPPDRHEKRAGTPRQSLLGPHGRQRLTRSRSSLDCGSENAPLEKPKVPTLPTSVLGDVTMSILNQRPPAAPDNVKPYNHEGVVGKIIFSDNTHSDEMDVAASLADDPQHVAEYAQDIFRNMQRDQPTHMPSPTYMDHQVHVNAKMRAILIDWLVEVHKKYKLRPETLFLAVNIIDRYLDVKVTAQRILQLVGVTSLLIAAKFEEVYPPQIKDFVYVTDKAYVREDILKMEVSILTTLQFKICQPTAVNFIERYQLVNGCTDAHRDLAQYLLELALVDYKMIKYTPSHLAAASILLSNKLLRRPSWSPQNVRHTGMTEPMLKECAKEMCVLLESAEHSSLKAVHKKFSQLKYHSVAKLNFVAPPTTAVGDRTAGVTRRVSTSSRRSTVPMDIA